MSLLDYRIGLAGGDMHLLESRQSPTSCNLQAGDLYLYPNATSTVDASQPVTFRWNTACTGISSTVDLYLYSSGSTGLIQAFRGLSFSQGSYTATLLPRWWNSTTTAQLQFNIVNSGGMSWATTGPAGPIWTVTYPESAMFQTTTEGGTVKTSTAAVAIATNSGEAIIQNVTNTKEGGISKGAVAAAVVVPLLVIAALAAIAVRFWRQREAEKRRRWSQALSHHSAMEWEKGARAGEKTQSILGRPSMSMYMRGEAGGDGGGRSSMATSSVYAIENNMAGAGAAGLARPNLSGLRSVSADNVNGSNASVRSSVIMPNGEVRQSRISFAESARPDRRSRMSFGGDLRPPNPAVFKLPAGSRSASELVTPRGKISSSAFADEDEDDLNISPTQRDGPGKPRVISGIRTGARKSVMSFVGGGDKRRESTASALSQQDFRSAVEAGGSVDELRDLEAMMLARRSVMSQYSANRSSSFNEPNSPSGGYSQHVPSQYSNPSSPALGNDTDRIEDLSQSDSTQSMNAGSYFKPLPSASSTSTVAYGPDQMLAVYAARAANAKSPPGSAGSMGAPAAPFGGASTPVGGGSMGKKGGMKILTGFGRKDSETGSSGYSDVQRDTLSPTGGAPSPSLRVPPVVMTRQRSGTVGRGGQPSPMGDDVGHAQ